MYSATYKEGNPPSALSVISEMVLRVPFEEAWSVRVINAVTFFALEEVLW